MSTNSLRHSPKLEEESEPEKKTKLRAIAIGIGGMARDIAVGVIARKIGDL